jgi:predicted Fe-Mo cluster-binding NifX family protein
MKIALVTDDGKTISAHFGRAAYYAVVEIADGQVVGREMREKPSHEGHHGPRADAGQGQAMSIQETWSPAAGDLHVQMAAPILDCEVVIARGMGGGAYAKLREAGIRPVLTDARDINEAARQYARGELVDHPERLH